MKVFNKIFWSLFTFFWAIFLVISVCGSMIAIDNSSNINEFLRCETFVKVDDSSNDTPDVMYYKSNYMQYRWYWNQETRTWEFQTRWNKEGLHSYIKAVNTQVDTEGTVLLWNNNETLPLKEKSNISLFGVHSVHGDYVSTGFGSGSHAMNEGVTLQDYLSDRNINVNPDLKKQYFSLSRSYGREIISGMEGDINYSEFKINEAPWSEIESSVNSSIAQYGDSAVFIITRIGNETGDTDFNTDECLDNNYQDLSKVEVEILEKLSSLKREGKIKNIVLVLNTCNAMQFKNIKKHDIDACLWVGNGGTTSYRALADVLSGKADPNGHLNDIYLNDSYSAPATVNMGDYTFTEHNGLPATAKYTWNSKYLVYQEGIYVGYRYYETRYEDTILNQGNANSSVGAKESKTGWNYDDEVAFPFGYGNSYASFEQSNFKVTKNIDGSYKCSIDIKNISEKYSGKDVFQVYLQKPYTDYDKEIGIEKSAVELVGFAKTDLLGPGQSQTVSVDINSDEFKAYDSYGKKTYILEKGDYYLAAGLDSHNAINNILTEKGVDKDLLDGDSNSSMVHKITIDNDNYNIYSVSSVTGTKVTNQFDNADLNIYENTKNDQNITYLSRKDWEATYPKTNVNLKCTNSEMIKDMQYGATLELEEGGTMPLYNQNNGMSLIELKYEDYYSSKWDKLLDQMTYEEQVGLTINSGKVVHGATTINAPGGKACDGPAGIRAGDASDSIAYPSETLMACTFNTVLIEKLGEAFGMEMMMYGYSSLYGPGANIHRTNFSGRNFEYFSEDGVLSGWMLRAEVKGLRSKGVFPVAKHFVLNDQERNRYGVSVWANEQTIREIYLRPFEYSIKEGNSLGLMTSFNRIGCTWSGEHKGLLTEVLRKEWGFKGATQTDCAVGVHMNNFKARTAAIMAGQDFWLSGGNQPKCYDEYKNNPSFAMNLRRAAKNILYAQLNSTCVNGLKSGVKIIELTPWWEHALNGIIIGASSLTGIGVLMFISSFIVPMIKNKKEVN